MNEIKILFAGDFAPCLSVEDAFFDGNRAFMDADIQDNLMRKDISLVNIEVPLTNSTSPISKIGPSLKANPDLVEILTQAGFDVACLANNHIYDYGHIGLEDTLNLCQKNGILTVGAGYTLEKAKESLFLEIKGRKIAVINFAENEFCNATSGRGGASPMNLIENVLQIQDAKGSGADIVLCVVHGGHEFYHLPSPRMVKEYRFYVDNGADAVISHHTHCIGPYEMYKGKPIIYSLGNFLFPSLDYNEKSLWKKYLARIRSYLSSSEGIPPSWFEGYLVRITFKDNGVIDLETIPYKQCEGRLEVRHLTPDEKQIFYRKIESLNIQLQSEEEIELRFLELARKKAMHYLSSLSMWGRLQRRVPYLEKTLNERKLMQLQNCIRCESHRDLSLAALKDRLG